MSIKFSLKKIKAVFNKTKGHCAYCGCELQTIGIEAFHMEHVNPRSRGGNNSTENLFPACPWCNMKKHNKTLEEFRAVFFGLQCTDRRFYFETEEGRS